MNILNSKNVNRAREIMEFTRFVNSFNENLIKLVKEKIKCIVNRQRTNDGEYELILDGER